MSLESLACIFFSVPCVGMPVASPKGHGMGQALSRQGTEDGEMAEQGRVVVEEAGWAKYLTRSPEGLRASRSE